MFKHNFHYKWSASYLKLDLIFLFQFLIAELNLFYLKFILWIPPPHFLMQARLLLFLCTGAVALNETFRYMDDP